MGVLEAVQRKRAHCGAVLKSVPLFANMTETEVENIIDALKLEKYPQGHVIIRQGEEGNHFYIIYEGQVVASRQVPETSEVQEYLHQVGDYFGELALLHNNP